MLHKIGRYISKRNLISLYYALVQSHLTYYVTSWGGPETPGLNQINKLISKCSKFINNKVNDSPAVNINFKPLNIHSLFKLEACKLVHCDLPWEKDHFRFQNFTDTAFYW